MTRPSPHNLNQQPLPPHHAPWVRQLPVASWPQVTDWVQSNLVDLAHRGTGRWQPRQVRLDVPPALAGAPRAQYQPLVDWLAQRHLRLLLLGSRRADVRLEVS